MRPPERRQDACVLRDRQDSVSRSRAGAAASSHKHTHARAARTHNTHLDCTPIVPPSSRAKLAPLVSHAHLTLTDPFQPGPPPTWMAQIRHWLREAHQLHAPPPACEHQHRPTPLKSSPQGPPLTRTPAPTWCSSPAASSSTRSSPRATTPRRMRAPLPSRCSMPSSECRCHDHRHRHHRHAAP